MPLFVLFLSLAAGALIYVIGEMFGVGRRMNSPTALAAARGGDADHEGEGDELMSVERRNGRSGS